MLQLGNIRSPTGRVLQLLGQLSCRECSRDQGQGPPDGVKSTDKRVGPGPSSAQNLNLPLKGPLEFGDYQIVGTRQRIRAQVLAQVPRHIGKPEYYASGEPRSFTKALPIIKFEEELPKIRESCRLARFVLDALTKEVKVGVSTEDLNNYAHHLIVSNGAYPSPLNYKKFPKSICTSVNNVVCHGIPDERRLVDTDILNIDVTVFLEGYHGDCSETVQLPAVDKQGTDLIQATKVCLYEGINACGPGVPIKAIGQSIEAMAEKLGFKVVPVFTGHGIGTFFHEPPDIYHIDYPYPGLMRDRMTFTIEPILSQGTESISIQEDGWTAITQDGSRSAQFEHTVLITDFGTEILT